MLSPYCSDVEVYLDCVSSKTNAVVLTVGAVTPWRADGPTVPQGQQDNINAEKQATNVKDTVLTLTAASCYSMLFVTCMLKHLNMKKVTEGVPW